MDTGAQQVFIIIIIIIINGGESAYSVLIHTNPADLVTTTAHKHFHKNDSYSTTSEKQTNKHISNTDEQTEVIILSPPVLLGMIIFNLRECCERLHKLFRFIERRFVVGFSATISPLLLVVEEVVEGTDSVLLQYI